MDNMFSEIDFGPLQPYLDNDDITDISYSNGGQVWIKTLSKGMYREDNPQINNPFMEKLAFQCSNVMGSSFNMAHPFLDAEGSELRLNFVHDSIAKNGIAVVIRKTPAKIRLEKGKILKEKYIEMDIHDLLVQCVQGHCNIIAAGETGSGKTEFIKYLASKIREDEKIITIEDTLELHLDRIFPHRDIVSMKTNNIASYTDVLVTCMRQNPKWILLSEVRSAEAVLAVRNSISSGHYILSTIHADKAASIPQRLYSLLETNQDIEQFVKTIHRYVQLGVYIRGFTDRNTHKFVREIAEVTEFYVDEDNNAKSNTIYKKAADGKIVRRNPSKYLKEYLETQGVILNKKTAYLAGDTGEQIIEASENLFIDGDEPLEDIKTSSNNITDEKNDNIIKPLPQKVSQNVPNVPNSNQIPTKTMSIQNSNQIPTPIINNTNQVNTNPVNINASSQAVNQAQNKFVMPAQETN